MVRGNAQKKWDGREPEPAPHRDRSECQPRAELNFARIAAEHLVPLAEDRVAGRQVVRRAGAALGVNVVDAAGRVLRMIEGIEEIRPETEFRPLLEHEVLE